MLLRRVHVRFYKSFNFDYLRKYHPKAKREHWEELADSRWFPFVRVPIDREITAVVGANESGKTHLLDAIECGITGAGIKREDVCRYSDFFTVKRDEMAWPDFGFEWVELSQEEATIISDVCKTDNLPKSFFMHRHNRDSLTIYLPDSNGEHEQYRLEEDAQTTVLDLLPRVFRIDASLALPESVSLQWLIHQAKRNQDTLPLANRKTRLGLLEELAKQTTLFVSKESITASASQIHSIISPYLSSRAPWEEDDEYRLASDLLFEIAGIDVEALEELSKALQKGREGYVNAIVQEINKRLAATLNFPKWWAQDRNFQLRISPRESDLVLTVRDRTGRDYSFGERSNGLKYFLSYYIQYLAYRPSGKEILLMDEPDAFLSSQGQQDLLKIFSAFARPADERTPIQIVYVTHSPFLIDKNHSERVRVLQKGEGDEGTRIVNNAARNHYEPLRSAFGAMVGERVFIGNCNLIVEGQTDQILLAGAASFLRRKGCSDFENLDLNHITIVPAGSAGHVPYLVFLARGRDVEKPSLIVLLDSDDQGDSARADLKKGGPRQQALLNDEYVLQVGDISDEDIQIDLPAKASPCEIEDLIPLSIAIQAGEIYLRQICSADEATLSEYTEIDFKKHLKTKKRIFPAICTGVKNMTCDLKIEKMGFARSVVEIVERGGAEGLESFEQNMKILLGRLAQMQRAADREMTSMRVSDRVGRTKRAFLRDRKSVAKKEHAALLFEEIESVLDESQESDIMRTEIRSIYRDFELRDEISSEIPRYNSFKERLERLTYAPLQAVQDLVPDSEEESGSAFGTNQETEENAEEAEVEPTENNEEEEVEATGAS